jgi:C1A family cysteine protease
MTEETEAPKHYRPLQSLVHHRKQNEVRRNFKFQHTDVMTVFPEKLSWLEFLPPVYDQMANGSCTANAYCGTLLALSLHPNPSRAFIYACLRLKESPNQLPIQDNGANLLDAEGHLLGVASEPLWPYVCNSKGILLSMGQVPSQEAYADAKNHIMPALLNITPNNHSQIVNVMKTNLCNGYLIDMAFLVYASMMTDQVTKSGVLPYPSALELQNDPEGGHEVYSYGFDDSKQAFLCQNSWGGSWGQQGRFEFPYSYCLGKNGNNEKLLDQILILPVSLKSKVVPVPPVNKVSEVILKLQDCIKELQSL